MDHSANEILFMGKNNFKSLILRELKNNNNNNEMAASRILWIVFYFLVYLILLPHFLHIKNEHFIISQEKQRVIEFIE